MTGQIRWAIYGGIAAIVGVVMLVSSTTDDDTLNRLRSQHRAGASLASMHPTLGTRPNAILFGS